MNWVDYVIIGIVVFSSIVSIVRGFTKEILSLVSWILAIVVTYQFYETLADLFTSIVGGALMRTVVAIFILFVVSLIIFSSISYILGEAIRRGKLSGTDRFIGMIFGMVRGVLLVAVLLFIIDTFTPLARNQQWKDSMLIPQFNSIIGWFFDYLKSTSSFLIHKGKG